MTTKDSLQKRLQLEGGGLMVVGTNASILKMVTSKKK